jgi:cytidyltransferase-like protein
MYKKKVYKWSNKNPTVQMLGRFQPWHNGHQKLFEKILKKTGQVYIMVKNVHGIGDNPFTFKEVKLNIDRALKKFPNRYKVVSVPNITNICYGRTVGYKIEKINLDKKIHQISATKIRDDLRKKGKL